MEIIPGRASDVEDCARALADSELGRRYFAEAGAARRAVDEGLAAGTLYVAVDGPTLCGFLYYIPDGAFHSFPYLHLLVVAPAARGRGVGTTMLRFLESKVARQKIFLCVADFNPDAKRFYLRNGYRQVGRIDSLYRPGVAEELMMWERGRAEQQAATPQKGKTFSG